MPRAQRRIHVPESGPEFEHSWEEPGAPQWGEVRFQNVDIGPDPWGDLCFAQSPGIQGDHVAFVTLPSGEILVIEGGEGDLSPLADEVERHVARPYEAQATRQYADHWAVAAIAMEVAEFRYPDAKEMSLSYNDGQREFLADGQPRSVSVPELEQIGRRVGPNYLVRAIRIDGDFWSVQAHPL